MSTFTIAKTVLRDMQCLQKALKNLGFKTEELEYSHEAKALYGYQGDARDQKANLIIRRQHVGSSSNDIGFEKQKDGTIVAHISEYDRGAAGRKGFNYGDKFIDKLSQQYALEKVREECEISGFLVDEVTVDEDGWIEIEAENYVGF